MEKSKRQPGQSFPRPLAQQRSKHSLGQVTLHLPRPTTHLRHIHRTQWMAPPPPLQWLTTLKATQLKALSAAIGTTSSGTKPTLIHGLQAYLPAGFFPLDEGQHERTKHDITSIDMGIRNLAYCRITLPPHWPSSTRAGKSVPTISEWARIAVSSKEPPAASGKKRTARKEATEVEEVLSEVNSAKEAFDPSTLSGHAYNLVTHLLSQHASKPSQILIERQRFRSMGGSAVQEWTLRVNMFEAMLYAVLRTLKERGEWAGEVRAVAPSKVGRFWLGDKEGVDELGEGKGNGRAKKVSKSARTKTAKIGIVEEWLEEVLEGKEEGRFKLEGNARELGEAFLRKRKGGRDVRARQESIGGTGTGGAEVWKLDDLADCLLQGMAWVKWEENRKMILDRGIDALDEII